MPLSEAPQDGCLRIVRASDFEGGSRECALCAFVACRRAGPRPFPPRTMRGGKGRGPQAISAACAEDRPARWRAATWVIDFPGDANLQDEMIGWIAFEVSTSWPCGCAWIHPLTEPGSRCAKAGNHGSVLMPSFPAFARKAAGFGFHGGTTESSTDPSWNSPAGSIPGCGGASGIGILGWLVSVMS